MNLVAKESEMYFSMASLSGTESEYNLSLHLQLTLGGNIPDNNSIAQS